MSAYAAPMRHFLLAAAVLAATTRVLELARELEAALSAVKAEGEKQASTQREPAQPQERVEEAAGRQPVASAEEATGEATRATKQTTGVDAHGQKGLAKQTQRRSVST